MKRSGLLLLPVLFMAAILPAQDYSTENKQDKNEELETVVGCLSKTANTYVITGGGPGAKQFRIIGGDTSMLKRKIGQSVKVVGMVGESDPTKVASPPYNEGSTTGAGYNTIVAQKIKVLGGLCSRPGAEYKGDHE